MSLERNEERHCPLILLERTRALARVNRFRPRWTSRFPDPEGGESATSFPCQPVTWTTCRIGAPDQVEGEADQIDSCADIIVFGAVVYKMATAFLRFILTDKAHRI
jgi:hypothetical protein